MEGVGLRVNNNLVLYFDLLKCACVVLMRAPGAIILLSVLLVLLGVVLVSAQK